MRNLPSSPTALQVNADSTINAVQADAQYYTAVIAPKNTTKLSGVAQDALERIATILVTVAVRVAKTDLEIATQNNAPTNIVALTIMNDKQVNEDITPKGHCEVLDALKNDD